MPSIREFNVVKPPTSGEVQQEALEALKSNGILRLTIVGQEQVPPPEEMDVEFRIAQTTHPKEGGMRIAGSNQEGNSVVVTALGDLSKQAVASIVTQ